jgi:hypothetical protein
MMRRIAPVVLAFVLGSLATAGVVHADPHAHMRSALDHLQSAREELKESVTDKGGHREKAIEATQSAIEQVKKGMEFDDAH